MSFQPLLFSGFVLGQSGSGGSGTVTSVGLSLPAIFTVTGSPVTTSGTLGATLNSQSANLFFASPNGAPGAPTFRSMVAADVPILNQNTTGTAANITASSNNTLTTLSSLSLPYSQITGTPSAVAPGGSDTNIQFNDSNSFGGDSNFSWINTNKSLRMGPSTSTVTGAFASGFGTTASGVYSQAFGNTTVASGNYSFAEGESNTSSGEASHAEGLGNIASGDGSHAEGQSSVADNIASHAEGNATSAHGKYSHSAGDTTIANADNQTVVGQFNIAVGTPGSPASTDEVFTVGNGANSGARATAFSVRRDGLINAHSNLISNVLDPVSNQDAVTLAYFNAHSGAGSVTSVSVVSANGLAGTVATATSTPAITLTTTITGVLKGNGTAISAATSGTDYSAGTSGLATGILKSTTTTGALTIAVAGDFPTLNQNTTGTAANITASSNSSLTTLSSLSLPTTQLTGTLQAAQEPAHTGDVTNTTGSLALTIATNAVTNAKAAQMATLTIKGNNTGGTANASDLTVAQVNSILPVFTSTLNGLVPLSGGGTTNFLRADGTFAAPAGTAGITALTGDITATGPGSVAATLATVNSNTGSFGSSTSIPNFTVNGKGLITAAGSNVVIAPAGTLSGTTLNSTVVTSSLTSVGTQAQALNMGSHKITSVTDPTLAQDAATKAYVDNIAAGINPAVAVQAATTSAANTSSYTYNNGAAGIGATLTGPTNTALTVDGFTFTTLGQRLLVKNDTQSPSGAFNGVYYVTQIQTAILPLILTRALDYDQPSDINNTGAIPVINGTVNGTTQWVLTSLVTTVGTDPLTFTQFARNPADYLLKANNLSDVSTKATSFNNISPVTTTGDIIYSSSGATNTRLPIGTSGQVLTVSAGVPTWQPAPGTVSAFFASSQVTTTSSTITGGTYTTFSNSPAFTFTPTITGTYKVYSNPGIYSNANNTGVGVRVFNTTGGATLLEESPGGVYTDVGGAPVIKTYTQSIYTLTAGISYVFDLQGAAVTGAGLAVLDGSNAGPFYMFAELEVTGTSGSSPALVVNGQPANVTGGNPIIFPTVINDTASAYNATTGQYTASITGFYLVCSAFEASTGTGNKVNIYINGSISNSIGTQDANSNFSGSGVVNVISGQTIDIRPANSITGFSATATTNAMSINLIK